MHMVRQSWGLRPPRIVIVGAGISGAGLAVMLRGVDADVTVLRQSLPPGRTSTFHGIVDRHDWKALGIDPPVGGGRPVTSVRVTRFGSDGGFGLATVDGWTTYEHRDLLGYLAGVSKTAGIPTIDATVTALVRRGAAITGVRTDDGQVIEADLVVFADESDPRLPEQLGLRPDWPPTAIMHLGKARYEAGESEIAARFSAGDGNGAVVSLAGEASWGSPCHAVAVPCGEAFTVCVAMLLEDEMAHARHIREVFDEFEVRSPLLPLVRGLDASTFVTEVVPVGGFDLRQSFHTSNVLVVNDLVGVTHPLNRDGLSTNLDMCVVAAEVIREAVAARTFTSEQLGAYSRGLQSRVLGTVSLHRRQDRSLRQRPAWQWANKPELLSQDDVVTDHAESANLTLSTLWSRFRTAGQRGDTRNRLPGAIDE